MKLTIVIPFKKARSYASLWAYQEAEIQFDAHFQKATRCTMSFAAIELRYWLKRIIKNLHAEIDCRKNKNSFNIVLAVNSHRSQNDSFSISPFSCGVVIRGKSRTGLLYGVYEFLRYQGIRWCAPGEDGVYLPPRRKTILKPDSILRSAPDFARYRGFDFESDSMESAELLLWMARNYLNMCGYRPSTASLARKLGMKFKNGGHIFEMLLDPNKPIEQEKTIWEAHPDWYGTPLVGQKSKEKALQTQFCVTNKGLQKYLIYHILKLINTKWQHVDLLDVWGFDTWGNVCSCPKCLHLGNGSDQMLYFLSCLRTALNRALKKGVIKRTLNLSMCAYEGTSTFQSPQNGIPENLTKAKDVVVIYPINRCYAHSIDDKNCMRNQGYWRHITMWAKHRNVISLMIGEYYNVSRFEDLPALFTHRMLEDIKCYKSLGFESMTYMHIPMVNWAVRTLTQNLYAHLCWQSSIDAKSYLESFFIAFYGPFHRKMRRAYNLIERAFQLISDWRAWGNFSILSCLHQWDGDIPVSPLLANTSNSHFPTDEEAIKSGKKSVFLLKKALKIISMCISENRKYQKGELSIQTLRAANPRQISLREQADCYEKRLGEDRRLIIYGIDSISLMWKLVCYYDYLLKGEKQHATKIWAEIESLSDKMDCYYIPINYEWPTPGLVSRDALTRTQLRSVICRCRTNYKKIFKKLIVR